MYISPYLQGLGMGASLIVAIGAQNAFVLSQSIRRNHHKSVAGICILCDCLLITIGVLGVGAMFATNPLLRDVATWGGAAFLLWFGFSSFRSALRGGSLHTDEGRTLPLRAAVAGAFAVSLLNPHAYLDTVVLLGGISTTFAGEGRYLFGAGALTASVLWFCVLSLGGRALAPVFRKPSAWRVLDGLVCAMVWTIAIGLVRQAVTGS